MKQNNVAQKANESSQESETLLTKDLLEKLRTKNPSSCDFIIEDKLSNVSSVAPYQYLPQWLTSTYRQLTDPQDQEFDSLFKNITKITTEYDEHKINLILTLDYYYTNHDTILTLNSMIQQIIDTSSEASTMGVPIALRAVMNLNVDVSIKELTCGNLEDWSIVVGSKVVATITSDKADKMAPCLLKVRLQPEATIKFDNGCNYCYNVLSQEYVNASNIEMELILNAKKQNFKIEMLSLYKLYVVQHEYSEGVTMELLLSEPEEVLKPTLQEQGFDSFQAIEIKSDEEAFELTLSG